MKDSYDFREHQGKIQILSKLKLKMLMQSYYFYEFEEEFDIHQEQILEFTIINNSDITNENEFFINHQLQNTSFNIETQIECDDSVDKEIKNFNKELIQFKINHFPKQL